MWFGTGDEEVRIDAFLLIRALALTTTSSTLDFLLKHTYLTFVRNSKFYSKNSG